ncbi:hypothetical protein CQW49_15160 [Methylosinus trichosporium OB3b]|uniref:Uncharacterized protein n=1 Tax=Methylosinus trichosporium (strain ATCC 35070 / NCIMB 11131 / UNIQEM 75 / OB3b) TaxID=595536 RepID=A0A2D2D235_METT3|nr:hypothetical protein [Methylosinus trichosporium]ATQ69065.1 hypothetical protein CQW49_15160 [Methylosinus trichosporium OB3b]OBS51908.1 hypothetical protein A8B73_13880 [Methylosinus sp. 3S-1]
MALRSIAGIEATQLGLDILVVVTNLSYGAVEWLYEPPMRAWKNVIKLHNTRLSFDRTSYRSALNSPTKQKVAPSRQPFGSSHTASESPEKSGE